LSSYAIILYSLVQHNATYREESLTAFVFTERIQSLTMCVLHLASWFKWGCKVLDSLVIILLDLSKPEKDDTVPGSGIQNQQTTASFVIW